MSHLDLSLALDLENEFSSGVDRENEFLVRLGINVLIDSIYLTQGTTYPFI